MRFKLTEFYLFNCAVPNYVKITPYGDCSQYKHTMEEVDKFKRNKKLMELAGSEMQKWYKPKDIKNAIKLNNNLVVHVEFEDTSGTFFKLKDVYNDYI